MRYSSATLSFVLVLVGFIFLLPKTALAYEFNFVMPTFSWPTFNFSVPAQTMNNFILPTMAPTVVSTALPTARPTPTATPKPSNSPQPTIKPVSSSAPVITSNVKDYIMNGINNYRAQNGLSKVQTDSNTCNFAKIRAKEISTSFNHNGFTSRVNSKTLPYSGYSSVTENIAMHPDYQQAVPDGYKQVVPMWINSPSHAANMRADTPYVCVESYGNYYAYEGWRP